MVGLYHLRQGNIKMASTRDLFGDTLRGLKVPEFGLSELLGGDKTSLNRDITNTILTKSVNDRGGLSAVQNSGLPQQSRTEGSVLGSATNQSIQPSNKSTGGSSSSGSSSSGGYDASAMLKAAGIDSSQKSALFKQYGVSDTPSLIEAMKKANDAQLQSAKNQYDLTAENLRSQLGALGSQRESSLSNLNAQLTDYRNQVGTEEQRAKDAVARAIDEALNTAKDTQRSNRNTLRGLGILASSAAGDIMSRPLQEYDKQRATLNQDLTLRLEDLQSALTAKTAEHAQMVKDIESQYAQLVGNIQRDLRFNDFQKQSAIENANAILQQNIAQILQQQQQYEQQVALAAQQYSLAGNSLLDYNLPTSDVANTSISGAVVPQSTPQQVGIYDPLKDQQNMSLAPLQSMLPNQSTLSGY